MNERERIRQVAAELLRRKRATRSFHTFGMSVDIPTVVGEAPEPDETLCPAEFLYALHHRIIMHAIERTINRPFGRLLIQAPPGSAKSTYASVVLPPYVMGRQQKFKFILASYASELAWVQSGRAMQIVEQEKYRQLAWNYSALLELEKKAQAHWGMNNGSECIAAGLLAGITGHRADGWVIDDPVAGQKEADSKSNRDDVWNAYKGDLLTRVKPEAWGILIQTRWHEDDLAGRILPEGYKGQSGTIRCRDGLDWEVLNIPAKADHADDPLGRQIGEYLWPEWFPPQHWAIFENGDARTWSSLYQQNPTPAGTGQFKKEMFNWYKRGELPTRLAKVGAGDYAVTKDGGDYTEYGVVGLDSNSNMWFLDWYFGQETSDVWIDGTLAMARRHNVKIWFNEGGVIDKSTRPAFNKAMREMKDPVTGKAAPYFVDIRSLPSMQDKVAKLQAFQARASGGSIWLPEGVAWAERLVELLCAFPAARHDDGPDVCGLFGRAIDQLPVGATAPEGRKPGILPFSAEWLEYEEKPDTTVRYQ